MKKVKLTNYDISVTLYTKSEAVDILDGKLAGRRGQQAIIQSLLLLHFLKFFEWLYIRQLRRENMKDAKKVSEAE